MFQRKLFAINALLLLSIAFLNLQVFAQSTSAHIKKGEWRGQSVEYLANRLIVKYAAGSAAEAMQFLSENYSNIEFEILNADHRWCRIDLPAQYESLTVIDELSNHPALEEVLPDIVIRPFAQPNDADFQLQWALENVGQLPASGTAGADISALNAWDISTGNSQALISVLDSGIPLNDAGKLSHPDLNDANRFILGPDFLSPGANNASGVKDELGHGTHVTGILGAQANNGVGIAGVAWNSPILVMQTLGTGWGSLSLLALGIWASIDSGATVINVSAGALIDSYPVVEEAVAAALANNIIICAAAGNDGANWVGFPANLNMRYENVIAVAATDHHGQRAPFSNYGGGWSEWVINIGAPGGFGGPLNGDDIWSTLPGYPTVYSPAGESYGYLYGTSMATPHVTGAVALLQSINPDMPAAEIRELLQATADPVAGQTWGNLNILRALENPMTGIARNEAAAEEFALLPNYPNPFNPETTIRYELPGRTEVTITVYDILGREVRTLVDGWQNAGENMVIWDGLNYQGQQASSGVYIYTIQAGSFMKSRKMTLLR